MYASTLEKIDCKILFIWVTRRIWAPCSPSFLICFRFYLLLFSRLFGIVSFVTKALDEFQFQSQGRLSEISKVVAIRLKFNFNAVFIEWGNWITLFFVGRQDIVHNWDFPSKFSKNCHKRLVLKIFRHEYWEMIVKMCLWDRLICFANSAGMTLLAVFFLLPLPNCFLGVCLPTLFAAA